MGKITSSNKELMDAYNKSKDVRVRDRLMAIHLTLLGKTKREICEITGLCRQSITKYQQLYKVEGIDALTHIGKSSGRKRKLTAQQEDQLKTTIRDHTPDEVGFAPHHNWTIDIVAAYVLNTYGVKFTTSGMWDVMQRLGLSWTRPTYVLAKADPQKQEAFRQSFDEGKKDY